MDLAICRFFPNRKTELIQKHNSEKFFFGKRVISSLEKRFQEYGYFKHLLDQAQEEVLSFLRKMECPEVSGNIKKKFMEDIDVYISGILTNYITLKESIET